MYMSFLTMVMLVDPKKSKEKKVVIIETLMTDFEFAQRELGLLESFVGLGTHYVISPIICA